MRRLSLPGIVLLVCAGAWAGGRDGRGPRVPVPVREVAVTLDDLPGVSVAGSAEDGEDEALSRMTARLLSTLSSRRVPVVAFVNEGKLGPPGHPDPSRVELLERWERAGIELGNHTFGHLDLHRVPVADFQADVVRGEDVTRRLVEERGGKLRWFRHPYLHTGTSLDDRNAVLTFLAGRGYRIAPVTFDDADWVFARGYQKALDAGDAALARKIAEGYPPYMDSKFEYFERESRSLFGREIRQILLVHANSLNADVFSRVLDGLRRRGYAFVSLERALDDPAYASLDTFTGRGGISWLHRWSLSAGRRPGKNEPAAPRFVLEAAGVAGE